jgi:hypothetical protein
MLTPDEQQVIQQVEAFIDNLVLFQSFQYDQLASGTEKLISQDGNLVIRIAIVERS